VRTTDTSSPNWPSRKSGVAAIGPIECEVDKTEEAVCVGVARGGGFHNQGLREGHQRRDVVAPPIEFSDPVTHIGLPQWLSLPALPRAALQRIPDEPLRPGLSNIQLAAVNKSLDRRKLCHSRVLGFYRRVSNRQTEVVRRVITNRDDTNGNDSRGAKTKEMSVDGEGDDSSHLEFFRHQVCKTTIRRVSIAYQLIIIGVPFDASERFPVSHCSRRSAAGSSTFNSKTADHVGETPDCTARRRLCFP
jgi:hypothetical protein